MKRIATAFTFLVTVLTAGSAAQAQDQISEKDYILGNVYLTLWHEFGHALVSEFELPVVGKEEDAVDAYSIIATIDLLESEDTTEAEAEQLDSYLIVTADAWAAMAETADLEDESTYAGSHSLDQQRYFRHLCFMYGADAEFYEPVLEDFGVDLELMEDCEFEFGTSYDSWSQLLSFGAYREEGAEPDNEVNIIISAPENQSEKRYADWLKNWSWLQAFEDKVEGELDFDEPIDVVFENCGEPNAFWDPEERKVSMCYEFFDEFAGFHTGWDQ